MKPKDLHELIDKDKWGKFYSDTSASWVMKKLHRNFHRDCIVKYKITPLGMVALFKVRKWKNMPRYYFWVRNLVGGYNCLDYSNHVVATVCPPNGWNFNYAKSGVLWQVLDDSPDFVDDVLWAEYMKDNILKEIKKSILKGLGE